MWQRIWALLDRGLFGAASQRAGFPGGLLRLLRYPYAVLRDLSRGDINLRAMGLVYTTLLSLIPLLAFSFAILKVFGGHRDLVPIVYELFKPVGDPAATDLTTRVVQFANRVSSGVVGSVGLALLAWTLIGTIKKVEDSFNFVWHVEQPRSFARRITEYSALLVAGPVVLVGFIGLTHLALSSAPLQEVARLHLPFQQEVRATGLHLAPYAMVSAFFTVLYMMVPNTRVRWRPALVGAVVGGVLWAAVGKIFTAFVVYSTRLTIVYAGFAFIVAGLLWTYFGWLILLAGAQLSFYVQNPAYLRLGLQPLRLSAAEIEDLALRIMYFVGRAHAAGGEQWTASRLAAELSLPGIAVARMATTLAATGLLKMTDRGELVPGRAISNIRVREILELARNERTGHVVPRSVAASPVDRVMESLDEARRRALGELTLRELLDEAPRPALTLTHRQSSSH